MLAWAGGYLRAAAPAGDGEMHVLQSLACWVDLLLLFLLFREADRNPGCLDRVGEMFVVPEDLCPCVVLPCRVSGVGFYSSAAPTLARRQYFIVELGLVGAEQDHALRSTAKIQQLSVEWLVICIDNVLELAFHKVGWVEVHESGWAIKEHAKELQSVSVFNTHVSEPLCYVRQPLWEAVPATDSGLHPGTGEGLGE